VQEGSKAEGYIQPGYVHGKHLTDA
jgi:hypothetical protein